VSLFLNTVYLFLILAASPWLVWAAIRQGKYREGYAAKLFGLVPQRITERPCIWFHAVSVGEVNLLEKLLARIARDFPQFECVVSTTTKTGFDLARRKYANHLVFYCPLDFTWAVRRALRRIRPQILVLAELELWPNLIGIARRQGVQVAIVNGRLSEASWRGYRRIRPLVAPLLRQLPTIAAQNDEYADRFRNLGATHQAVHVTGSLKFDGAQTERGNSLSHRLSALAGLADDDIVFLAGSTQEPEEALALQTFRDLRDTYPHLRLILAPRHPQRCGEVAKLLDAAGLRWQKRSQLDDSPADPAARILLVDTVGELGGWWGTAHIAYVGGSLGRRGGQNMIEPAAYGTAVSFGPNTKNFREVVALLRRNDAAIVVHDGAELTAFVRRCLEQPAWAAQLGHRARQLVLAQRGAVDRTVALLAQLLQESHRRDPHPNAA
jgi:3-deoxy-D-manno-octulosonic-acid transferase